MRKTILFILSIFLAVVACKKDSGNPNWNVDLLAPLATSELGINKLLNDTLLGTNSDSSLKLVYKNDVYDFTLNNLFSIPDTGNSATYFMIPAVYMPGQSGPLLESQTHFDVQTVQLKTLTLKAGQVRIEASSSIQSRIQMKYTIPGAKKNGIPFEVNVEVPAATASSQGSISTTFDLSEYTFDLTGQNHNSSNTVYSQMVGSIPSDAPAASIVPGDHISINNVFEKIVPYYARGFFGQYEVEAPPSYANIDIFNRILSGKIGLESIRMKLSLENKIGVDASATLHYLSALNSRSSDSVSLSNTIVGKGIHLNRAVDNPFQSSLYSAVMDNSNSNAKSFFEKLPDRIGYSMKVKINPDNPAPSGNVSGDNDFVYFDRGLKATLDMEIPLNVSAEDLILADTTAFKLDDSQDLHRIKGGSIRFRVENGFPLEGTLRILMADVNGTVIDSMFTANKFDAASVDASGKANAIALSDLIIPATPAHIDNLIRTKYLYLFIKLNTKPGGQLLKIYSDYTMKVKVIGDFTYHVN